MANLRANRKLLEHLQQTPCLDEIDLQQKEPSNFRRHKSKINSTKSP